MHRNLVVFAAAAVFVGTTLACPLDAPIPEPSVPASLNVIPARLDNAASNPVVEVLSASTVRVGQGEHVTTRTTRHTDGSICQGYVAAVTRTLTAESTNTQVTLGEICGAAYEEQGPLGQRYSYPRKLEAMKIVRANGSIIQVPVLSGS